MAKRIVFRVRPNQGRWRVTRNDEPMWYSERDQKEDAVRYARGAANYLRSIGALAQLVIHSRDGRIQTEHTYGRDPARRKG